ncbi:MAG: hypothetical protein ACTSXE_02560 [Candidatus Thorarchaeota archaeon]
MKGMMLHCDAVSANIHDLKSVVLPENHEKFKDRCEKYGTVSHDRLVTSIRAMSDHAFGPNSIIKESFGLSGGRVYPGARFFGLFRFDFGATDAEKALVKGIKMAEDAEIVDAETDDAQVANAVLNDGDFFQTLSVEDQNIYLDMANETAQKNFLETKRHDAGEVAEAPSNLVTVDDDTIYPALAIRNSYDRTMSVGAAVGYNVFICDNLCLSGEISFSRKHTINAFQDVVMTMWSLMQSMSAQHEFDLEWRDHAKTIDVSERQGMEVLGVLAGNGHLNLEGGNKSQFALALKQWKNPQHEIFKDGSLWSLENAITFAQAKGPINKRLESGNRTVREIRNLTDGNWNARADEIALDAKACNKATVLDLIDVIAESQKRQREEAATVIARVDNLGNM